MFASARRGLREWSVSDGASDVPRFDRGRWERRRTPSRWTLERVRDTFAAGAEFEEAVREMQAAYVAQSGSGTPFVEW